MNWAVGEIVRSESSAVVIQVDEHDDDPAYKGEHHKQICDYRGRVAADQVRCRACKAAKEEPKGQDHSISQTPLKP